MSVFSFLIKPTRFLSTRKLSFFTLLQYLLFVFCYAYRFADPISVILIPKHNYPTYENTDILRIISALFIAPIIEEVTARGFLTTKAAYYWTVPTFLIFGCATNLITKEFESFTIFSLYFLIIMIPSFLPSKKKIIVKLFRKNYYLYFYSTALLFSLLHSGNFDSNLFFPLKFLVLVISYFPIAALMGFIRVKHGLKNSILFHSLLNLGTLAINSVLYA